MCRLALNGSHYNSRKTPAQVREVMVSAVLWVVRSKAKPSLTQSTSKKYPTTRTTRFMVRRTQSEDTKDSQDVRDQVCTLDYFDY